MVAALGQHLHRHILGDAVFVDQLAQKRVLGLARGGEADLNLLEPDLQKHVVKFELLFQVHRHDKALVAVAQVHAAPGGGLFNVVLLCPFKDMPGFDRRGIVPYMILGCVHHCAFASFKGWAPGENGYEKTAPQRQFLPLRDGTIVLLYPRYHSHCRPLHPGGPSVRSAKTANRACMITVRFRLRLTGNAQHSCSGASDAHPAAPPCTTRRLSSAGCGNAFSPSLHLTNNMQCNRFHKTCQDFREKLAVCL